jgi:hypothetical protein
LAGLCLIAIARMEGHLIYYTALLLGVYLPLRLLLMTRDLTGGPGGPGAAIPVCLAGAGMGFTAQLAAIRGGGAALFSSQLLASVVIYLLAAICVWLLLSWILSSISTLSAEDGSKAVSRGMAPLMLSPIYAVQFGLNLPHLGTALLVLLICLGIYLALPRLKAARLKMPRPDMKLIKPVLPTILGMAGAAGFMLYVKATAFDGSIAGKGRGLDEVKLFTPHLQDLWNIHNVHLERLVHLGYVLPLLALAGLLLLAFGRAKKLRNQAQAALWAMLALVSGILALGPTLPYLPLYELLYKHLPFFNFPRVPGRMFLLAVLMLALLAGWALRELKPRLSSKQAWLLGLILVMLISLDTWPSTITGVSPLSPPGRVEAAIKENLPTGPDANQRLLGLPIWPGDSHQSAAYELLITRTRAKMLNGYSPVVPRAYVEKVFKPLYPLDLGLVTKPAWEALIKNRVGQVVFFDDDQVYSRKVSPFPPALARSRLKASGAFDPLAREGNMFLWSLNPEYDPEARQPMVTSPVTSLWEAEWLPRNAGRLKVDQEASGYGLLFNEPEKIGGELIDRVPHRAGNVVTAKAGDKPGYLCFGPYKAYPPGHYQVRYRLRRGQGQMPGVVDVATDQGKKNLAKSDITPKLLPPDGKWHDVALSFELRKMRDLEFRVFFNGKTDLSADVVLVGFKEAVPASGLFLAQELWRQAGELHDDPAVPGGLSVLARPGHTPPLYLMHGPQQTLAPGKYRARFRLAGDGKAEPDAKLADLVVATDLGRRVLAHHELKASELGEKYRDISVEFQVPRRMELGLRVRYAGGGVLKLASVVLEPIESRSQPGVSRSGPSPAPQ